MPRSRPPDSPHPPDSPQLPESPGGVRIRRVARTAGAGRRGPVVLLLTIAVLAIVAVQAQDLIPRWRSPFAEQTKDRSGPAVLHSIRDMSRYEAASGSFQVIVDLEKDAPFLPDEIRGKRTLFVGVGSVDAYVDFSRMSSGAIKVNADRTAVTVQLPPAQLEETSLDPKRSYTFAEERGLLDRMGDFFSSNPGDQQQLYVLAAQKIQTAAAESGLRARADQNAKLMMQGLLKALGFTQVTVTYAGRA